MKSLLAITILLLASTACFGQTSKMDLLQELSKKTVEIDIQKPDAKEPSNTTPRRGLEGAVKVIFDSSTGSVRLVGSREDIAIVVEAIKSIESKQSQKGPSAHSKIKLNFQLADTVAGLLEVALQNEINALPKLTIRPVHFPEAILLVGPQTSVAKAKKLIEAIDSHPKFPRRKTDLESPSVNTTRK